MLAPGSGDPCYARNPFQNVRLFFYVSRSQQKTTHEDRPSTRARETQTLVDRAAAGGAPRRALPLVRYTQRPPPAFHSQSNRILFLTSRAPRGPKYRPFTNANPIRYDRKCLSYFSRALLTGRFRSFPAKILTNRSRRLYTFGRCYAKCASLQVLDIHQLIDSGINYNFTFRYSLICNNEGGEISFSISSENREINEYFCAGWSNVKAVSS